MTTLLHERLAKGDALRLWLWCEVGDRPDYILTPHQTALLVKFTDAETFGWQPLDHSLRNVLLLEAYEELMSEKKGQAAAAKLMGIKYPTFKAMVEEGSLPVDRDGMVNSRIAMLWDGLGRPRVTTAS